MLNLATFLEFNAKESPDAPAVIFGDLSISFSELDQRVNLIATALLDQGIGKGDKIALSCPNLPYFPMIYYAILKVGAVVAPLNVLLKSNEISYHLEDSQAKAFFCFEGTADLPMGAEGKKAFESVDSCQFMWMITADPKQLEKDSIPSLSSLMTKGRAAFTSTPCNPDDTAVILYTSGTTGKPKGAELSQSNLVMNTLVCKDLFKAQSSDKMLVVLPLFHSFGQTVQMNCSILTGGSIVLLPRFDPEAALKSMEAHGITLFAGVPTMYWALLNVPDVSKKFDLAKIASTLRLGVSGGASMPVEIMKQFVEIFKVPVLEGYGLSETSPVATFNRIDKEPKIGSVGLPVLGVDVKIINADGSEAKMDSEGEIVIRGHNVMKGYFGKKEATEEVLKDEGWFHTGDIGKKDSDGFVYIVDRLKDMIIRNGYNVYPREIEETLLTHPDVSMAAVIGVPHNEYGEEVKAFVIPKPNSKLDDEMLMGWCKEKLASYKYPRIYEICSELPMTATGKILKRELKNR